MYLFNIDHTFDKERQSRSHLDVRHAYNSAAALHLDSAGLTRSRERQLVPSRAHSQKLLTEEIPRSRQANNDRRDVTSKRSNKVGSSQSREEVMKTGDIV